MKTPILFLLLLLAMMLGVFLVPLMDNDAAHHAVVALNMVERGDYTTLTDVINGGVPYFDKPHLQFWLVAGSYQLFGVSGFVYKLSSLLFVMLALFSTYKLAEHLRPNRSVGAMASLILFSMVAFMLGSSVDIRMDAILTGAVIFAIWQGVLCVDSLCGGRKFRMWHYLGLALGLALAFSCKGLFGVVIVGVALLFYMLGRRSLRWLLSWRFLLVLVLFGVMILPELWAFYDQFGWQGVRFILYDQVLMRTGGAMGEVGASDPLFFVHTLLWTVLPWSALLFFFVCRSLFKQRFDSVYWLTVPSVVTVIVLLSFSSFKLPHYLNPLFPLMAIFLAVELQQIAPRTRLMHGVALTQKIVVGIMIVALVAINYWAFLFTSITFAVLIGALTLWLVFKLFTPWDRVPKIMMVSVAASGILWLSLNVNFYPQLMKYQAGNVVSDWCEESHIEPGKVYLFGVHDYSGSFDIGQGMIHKVLSAGEIDAKAQAGDKFYVFADNESAEVLRQDTLIKVETLFTADDYRITRLTPKFLNPSTRPSQLWKVHLLKIER